MKAPFPWFGGKSRVAHVVWDRLGNEEEHTFPLTWEKVTWKANGGMGNQSAGLGRNNAERERIWFSPHCLKQPSLFENRKRHNP